MARYQLTLAYDGSGFFGSQKQAGKRTVQGELEAALRTLGWDGTSILLSGRTDTGVHASGQVASADLTWHHADEDLANALNALLPPDVVVKQAKQASADFHPRYSATARTYHYRLFCQPLRDPFRERFAWRVWAPAVDGDLLNSAASNLLGTHDFSAFGSPTTPKGSTVRTVFTAQWQKSTEDEWQFEVQANAFLYRMVRRMVFLQVAVAQKKLSAQALANALAGQASAGERSGFPSGLAPAHGLMLMRVTYSESIS